MTSATADRQRTVIDLLFLTLGSVLFALAHPNPLYVEGVGPLGFLALLPLAWVVGRVTAGTAALYGLYFGGLTYLLVSYWAAAFHPLGLLFVPTVYALYHAALLPALNLSLRWKHPAAFFLDTGIWVSYEYLRTQGFLGYSYGNLGYSQYLFWPWIQSADWGGVWVVSFLTAAPAFFVSRLLTTERLRSYLVPGLVLGVFVTANLAYGFSRSPPPRVGNWRVALVQHDMDPWKGGLDWYRLGFERLATLTERALAEGPQAVIWSETAFVPSIEYHRRYRPDPETWTLVERFLDLSRRLPVPLVVGNGHGERVVAEGATRRRDWNAALVYRSAELLGSYRKVHLVPLTEHFPWRDSFPWLQDLLEAMGVNHWEAGTEWNLLNVDGVRIGTPICFEDTFGYLNREFVRAGADVLVNLTNDSWSTSLACMRQHFSMSLFRAVENRRSMVRATNGGWTGVIDPTGRILAELAPMTQGTLVVDVPLVSPEVRTFYTRHGDWLALLLLGLSTVTLGTLLLVRLTKGNRWFSIEGKDPSE